MKSIAFVLLCLTFASFTSDETVNVYLVRKGVNSGTAGPIKIFADGKIICELKNNSYSVHQLPVGTHKFSAQWGGKSAKEGANERAIELQFEPGKEYYLQVVRENSGLVAYANVLEMTASSWQKMKPDLKLDDCH